MSNEKFFRKGPNPLFQKAILCCKYLFLFNIPIAVFLFILFYCNSILNYQSLWVDKDPYSSGQKIKVGSIVKVVLKDGLKSEYEFEGKKDETHTIKSVPDKKIIPDLTPFNSDRSLAKKKNGKSKTSGKILGTISVLVTEIEQATGNLILAGTKETYIDKEKNVLRLTGIASPKDLKEDKIISSDSIANLKMEFQGSISEEILKSPDVRLKETKNPDGTVSVKAELSENEKQEIILKNLKRMLGESE
ncbi:MAG: flagellar basal body L-ring protein FlgH [Leptospiraceae bacterium]|nr:flagellar basal body L-ring protein FlgH [Leptospiraceae bacterium]